MPTFEQLHALAPKGRLLFCTHLVDALPKMNLGIYIGPTNAELITVALEALRNAARDQRTGDVTISPALVTLFKFVEQKANERVEEGKANDAAEHAANPYRNYGFSGAADTAGHVYEFISDYIATLMSAVRVAPDSCAEAFSDALKSHAIYSSHGDPKSGVHAAIKDAAESSQQTLESAYEKALLHSSADNAEPGPGNKPEPDAAKRATRKFDIFISFKNLDGAGRETRDCWIAKQISTALASSGWSVFFSLDSLERLGTSAYKAVIDDALDQASVLVVVGTSRENLESPWVRYEWDGFINDIIGSAKPEGRVFTILENLLPRDLPRGLRQFKTFQYSDSEIGKLIRYIAAAP
jgi:TIR domain